MKRIKTREELLPMIPPGGTIAEIGVFMGDFSMKIIEHCRPSRFYMVDRWIGRGYSGDKDGKNIVRVTLDKIYEDHIIPNFGRDERNTICRESSDDFFSKMEPDSLDAVYIDAAHNYRAVKKDLENSRMTVKAGGIIMGHDYQKEAMPGVYRAVNEFVEKHDLEIECLTEDGMPSFYIVNKK